MKLGWVLVCLTICFAQPCGAGKVQIVRSSAADLDGDGRPEKISIQIVESGSPCDYILSVGKTSVKGKLWEGVDGFAVVDLDPRDKYKEIAVHTIGPSDDYGYHFHWFDGKRIRDMGILPGEADFPGDGSALVHKRIDWAYAVEKYVPSGAARVMRAVPQDMYYVGEKLTVKKSFPIYRTRSGKEVVTNLKPGSQITVLAYSPGAREADGSFKSTAKDQYLVKSATGLLGWAGTSGINYENISDLPSFD